MPSLGKLSVIIGAETRELDRAVDNLDRKLGGASRRMRTVAIAATAMGAAIGAAFAKAAADGLKFVDSQAKLARQLDSTIDGLRAVQIAAKDAGASHEALASVLPRFNSRLAEAEDQTKESAKALKSLGLNARELQQMDLDQRMATIADQIRKLGLNAAQTGDFLRRMGIRNFELINLFRAGGDAIRNARLEVDQFGIGLSKIDAAKVEAANDAWDRTGRHVEGIKNQIAIGLAPVVKTLADDISKLETNSLNWRDAAQQAGTAGVRAVGVVLSAIGSTISFIERHPEVATIGLVGYALFGKKGIAAVVAGAALVDRLEKARNRKVAAEKGNLVEVNKHLEEQQKLLAKMEATAKQRGFDSKNNYATNLVRDEVKALETRRAELLKSRDAMTPYTAGVTTLNEITRSAATGTKNWGDQIKAAGELLRNFKPRPIGPANDNTPTGTFTPPGDEDKKHAEKMAKLREQLTERLAVIMEFAGRETEANLLREQAEQVRRQEWLAQLLQNELITRADYHTLIQQAEKKHQEALTKISVQGERRKNEKVHSELAKHAGAVGSILGNLTQAIGSETKAQFDIQKAFGIAESIVNTFRAINQALADPTLPAWSKIPVAAAIGAFGLAQVARLATASYNGGSSSSGGGSAGAAGAAPVASTPEPAATTGGGSVTHDVSINLQGSRYSQSDIRELIEQINEALGDGAQLRVA